MENIELYREMIKRIMQTGLETAPRWLKIREHIGTQASFDSTNVIFSFVSRKFNWKYNAAELIWYLSWDLDVSFIWQYAKMWNKIAIDWKVSSNYGYIVFYKKVDWRSQYEYVLDNLKKDKHSRQAIIRYNSDEHTFSWNKDFVCTLSNQFLIRDNTLTMIVNMRSNDIFYGFTYDFIWSSLLLQSLYLDLKATYPKLKLWMIIWQAWSMHIYENMFPIASSIMFDTLIKAISYKVELQKSLYDIIKNWEVEELKEKFLQVDDWKYKHVLSDILSITYK